MQVSLRLFAAAREAIGFTTLCLSLPEGATIADLRGQLGRDYPLVETMLATVAFAVDDEYVAIDHVLFEGAEVAVIPPVSGGSQELFRVTEEPLDAQALASLVQRDEAGAITLFYGVVRNHSEGRDVERLQYEAHTSMALRKLAEVAEETRVRFPGISCVGAWHRTGLLEVGETSLLVAVSAPHRREAIEACHWCVDRIKEVVPVWKKEFFHGGAVWVDGHIIEAPQPARE